MDEKEILLAMKRLRRIEEEARKRLIKEQEAKVKTETAKAKPAAKPAAKPKREAPKPSIINAIPPPLPLRAEVVKPPKKKKEPIPAAVKTLVWNKWVGEKEAETGCFCCRVTTISMRHFHCGHVISEKHGGKCTIDNMRPICANCNLSMGSMNMNEYIEKFGLHK
jgi:hypothetical protein